MEIITTSENYVLRFDYKVYLIAAVKRIPTARWNGKAWTIALSQADRVKDMADRFGFRFVDNKPLAPLPIFSIPEPPDGNIDLSFLKIKPYPFQRQGIQYAAEKRRLIIGDQPGLGKTLQSIAAVIYNNMFPCLVICPATLRENWRREWSKFSNKKALILNDNVKNNYHLYHEANLAQVFIVNYESLKKYFVSSIDMPAKKGFQKQSFTLKDVRFKKQILMFRSVIIDEVHRCKSTSTQQAKFVKGICTDKEMILGLSGTPVINKPKDLMAQLSIIGRMPDFNGPKDFQMRYCNGINEASNLQELNARLRSICFIRREKHEVLKDLPAKQRQVILVDIDNRKEYAEAEADLVRYLKTYKQATDKDIARSLRGEIMVRIGILKNISARGKLADVYNFVDDILDSGEKLVLFTHLKEVGQAVLKHYPGSVCIIGDQSAVERQSAIDRFQTDERVKLIVCSIKAAGVGITLTASSRVGFIELPWTFADCEQCEDRTHRIGQMDSVMAYYFLGNNTIDEKIYQIIQTKKLIANAVTGSSEQVPESVVDMMVNLFTQQNND